jgi:ABC-2 type transport system permease protein
MLSIFFFTMNRLRGVLLGWGIGLAVLGGYLITFYDVLADQQEQLQQLISQYPKELMAMFGDMTQLFTPAGYLHTEFFSYMPLILGIFIISQACGLLAGDEERGMLDLVLSHPLSRLRLFAGKILAFIITIFGILSIVWIVFLFAVRGTKLSNLTAFELLGPFLSLAVLLLFFGNFGLLLSMLLPSQRAAAMVASLALFASFFLMVMAGLDERLENVEAFFPFYYYQGGNALNGLNWSWLGILGGLAVLMALMTWLLFERRDIRVSGEGGWRIAGIRRA